MSKKPTGAAAGNSEAIRIYEAMEQERKRKLEAKAEARARFARVESGLSDRGVI